MSTLETQERFRKKSEIRMPVETQFNGSPEFILVGEQLESTKNLKNLAVDTNADNENVVEKLEEKDNFCIKCFKNIFRKKILYKRLPILQTLPNYSRADAIGDLIAGITVGMTVIPQGLAYAGVAGLPAQFGLYGAFIGCFTYVLLGTHKDGTIGSTAIASLMVYQFSQGIWQRAVLLTFLTGIIEIIMAIFKLGFLVDFVSGPVSAGFTSAVALIIMTSQMRNIFGLKNEGATFLQKWITMFNDLENISWNDTILGFVCVVFLITLRFVGRMKIGAKDENARKWHHNIFNRILWFICVTRNATLVICCIFVSSYLESQGRHYVRLTGHIPPGLPEVGLPPFSIESVPGNATAGITAQPGETFMEMINHLGYGLIIVPIISLLENTAVCKAFSKGKPIDATQELLAIGIANVANSFFKGYRANSGLARSSVNNASGVRTTVGNLYTGLVVIMSLMYLSDYFYYIPKAVLAAIIISAIIFQLQYHVIVPMWRSKRSDLLPGIFAFIACLVLPLEIGILIAIAFNLLFILYHSARPKVSLEILETSSGQRFLKLTPDRCLIFPSVEFVRNLVLKSGTRTLLPVVIDCTYIYGADYTAAKSISSMIDDFKQRNQQIIFFNLKPSVVQIFEGLNTQLVLCYNIDALTQALKTVNNCQLDEVATYKMETLSTTTSAASTITLTKL